jgi:(E)-4-hydroxy-3-methylbut-2-enyl-diphosphate synthase
MQVQTAKDHTSVRPWRAIQRRKSRKIRVGGVEVGAGSRPDPKMDNEQMVDHIVGLVEARAAELAAVPPFTPPLAKTQQAMEA